ncbi:MAG TPA: GNAT family protein [Salinarimonas sp.]|jgi:RimJ/RimL family protein N-acetyltransferase|nr:GNAT family protein [Salinarimonas sp.]
MIAIRAATPEDVPFVAGLERAPSSEGFVARFEPERHARDLADPANLYLIGERDGAAIGFAILWGLDDRRHGNVLLKRVAVTAPGTGVGRTFLRAVIERVFARPESHRLWLTVADHNARARHVYEGLGFVLEGRLREAHWSPERGRYDALQMSLLRQEWESARG